MLSLIMPGSLNATGSLKKSCFMNIKYQYEILFVLDIMIFNIRIIYIASPSSISSVIII